MDLQRIYREIEQARLKFALVELHPTGDGGVFVKAAFQTSAGRTYIVRIGLTNYPSQMPRVVVTMPVITGSKHQYNDGNICYLHPHFWNPGQHGLEFVLMRTAKWLNKHDVWRATGEWPGAEMAH
jgi:hypothetical protein